MRRDETTMTTAPFGTRDDIRDAEIQQQRQQLANRETQRAEQTRRSEEARRVLEDPHAVAPVALARKLLGTGTAHSSALIELVPSLPGNLPIRVLVSRTTHGAVDVGASLRIVANILAESGGAYASPSGRFWAQPVFDPFGTGLRMPDALPALNEPIYAVRSHDVDVTIEHEPSDDERACALELGRETVDALGPSKVRARDLAAALRTALATGPHAIEALAVALEEHGRPAQSPPDDHEPPRAA